MKEVKDKIPWVKVDSQKGPEANPNAKGLATNCLNDVTDRDGHVPLGAKLKLRGEGPNASFEYSAPMAIPTSTKSKSIYFTGSLSGLNPGFLNAPKPNTTNISNDIPSKGAPAGLKTGFLSAPKLKTQVNQMVMFPKDRDTVWEYDDNGDALVHDADWDCFASLDPRERLERLIMANMLIDSVYEREMHEIFGDNPYGVIFEPSESETGEENSEEMESEIRDESEYESKEEDFHILFFQSRPMKKGFGKKALLWVALRKGVVYSGMYPRKIIWKSLIRRIFL
ncbi:hypothetical protein AMTR_s00062p00110800 [Amborella trichopoda]|uniref:Uncharacterized protein n=1 Tax=Amborella trichopoda TaxID=13333 RepID=U5DGP2_AMBTC|nr:hypothetical protein AMTR_s00062p00110800 [Amborella trichopoda]